MSGSRARWRGGVGAGAPDQRHDSATALGQSLAEFAIVAPIVLAIIGAIVQFGLVFWAQNTLTQVVRDTGRWAVTQQSCTLGTSAGQVDVIGQANAIAASSSLLGYSSQTPWTSQNVTVTWNDGTPTPPGQTGDKCPPPDNTQVWFVDITVSHSVPTFFPGMQYLPGLGTCDSTGCHITLSSSAEFRMEPAP